MTVYSSKNVPVIHLPETDSTSNYLAAMADKGKLEEFTTVVTDFQTAGKGQRGNSWESEREQNLLFSTITYPSFLEVRKQFLLSQVVALGIKEELDTLADGFSIKWPNDIYWHDKKISGTLIENDLMGHTLERSIAGTGINVNQKSFTGTAPNPVSLWQITGKMYEAASLLNGILRRTIAYYEQLKQGKAAEISTFYHHALFRKEGLHRYRDHNGEFMAYIVCVRPEGTLILADESGIERAYAFKEVQYLL